MILWVRLPKRKSALNENKVVLELLNGEQLEVEDIKRAVKDTTLNMIPLYSAKNPSLARPDVSAQLYFGPGFEDRLELELNQMVPQSVSDAVTEEEKHIRIKEDELFSKLAAPPELLVDISDVCRDRDGQLKTSEQRPEIKNETQRKINGKS